MRANPNLEQLIQQFRPLLPTGTQTAQAIDHGESWEQIAKKAVNDGYIELASELGQWMQECLRQSS